MPPPVPVDSTTGVFMPEVLPNCSATVGGEGINGGRSDDPDLIAGFGMAGSNTPVVASASALAIVANFMSSLLFG